MIKKEIAVDETSKNKKKKNIQKHKFTTRGHVAFPLPQLDDVPKMRGKKCQLFGERQKLEYS